jgi:hypothetical protein
MSASPRGLCRQRDARTSTPSRGRSLLFSFQHGVTDFASDLTNERFPTVSAPASAGALHLCCQRLNAPGQRRGPALPAQRPADNTQDLGLELFQGRRSVLDRLPATMFRSAPVLIRTPTGTAPGGMGSRAGLLQADERSHFSEHFLSGRAKDDRHSQYLYV